MNTTIDVSQFTTFQDTEVEGLSCCHSVVRSQSAKTNPLSARQSRCNVKNKHREKGIKLTHHNSLNELNNSLHCPSLKMKSTRTSINTSLHLQKVMSGKDDSRGPSQSPSIKLFVTKKCQAYKNKKVKQHNQNHQLSVKPYLTIDRQLQKSPAQAELLPKLEPIETPQMLLTPKKTEGNFSTQRNTPRNINSSQFLNFSADKVEITVHEVQRLESTPAQSIIIDSEQPTYKKSSILVTSRSKKTLQRLYQRQIGKKMQILESQMSQQSQADQVSIAESFDWRERF